MRRRLLPVISAVAAGLVFGACNTEGVDVPDSETAQIKQGAKLFDQRCSGCHTLSIVGGQGSSFNVNDREYKDGPNFNQRQITYDQVLYAIRNGGFSSGPMPQNIVVGEEAEAVAAFLAKYAGGDIGRTPDPSEDPAGVTGESPVQTEDTPKSAPEPGNEPPPAASDEQFNTP